MTDDEIDLLCHTIEKTKTSGETLCWLFEGKYHAVDSIYLSKKQIVMARIKSGWVGLPGQSLDDFFLVRPVVVGAGGGS